MEISEKLLEQLVSKVIDEFDKSNNKNEKTIIFESIEEAIEKAKNAQKKLFDSKLEMREKIIKSIRVELLKHVEELSQLAIEETGMGRVEDKILKNRLAIEKTPGIEDLKAFAFSGDDGLTVLELSPYGVIGAITPSTNPSETIICNSIGMIAAGNSIIFAPHPGAKKTSIRTVELINEAILKVCEIENLIVTIKNPGIEATNKILENENIKMIVATGGPGMVKTVMSCGKKAIGAGAGNPPVLVDETADLEKAARDIVSGCSFDNNLPCIAEKEVIAVDSIVDFLIFQMEKSGAYHLNDEQKQEELKKIVLKNGVPNRLFVGKDAKYILENIGIKVGDEIKVIILETTKDHIFAKEEMLMPILPIIRVKDSEEGIKVCKILENGNRHTAIIHSKNIDTLTKYARYMETTILVKNGPSYSGIGVSGEGYTTFTIAGPTGEGLTSAKSFARNRRCVLVGGFSLK